MTVATIHVDLTCPFCGMTADARRHPVVQVAAEPRRYAHEKCWLRRLDEELEKGAK